MQGLSFQIDFVPYTQFGTIFYRAVKIYAALGAFALIANFFSNDRRQLSVGFASLDTGHIVLIYLTGLFILGALLFSMSVSE